MNRLPALVLAALSGGVASLAFPMALPWISIEPIDPAGHLEVVAWIALVPVLAALDRIRSFRGALLAGWVAGVAFFTATIWWIEHAMTSFGGVSLPLALLALALLVAYMALHWALALGLAWLARQRLGGPWALHLPPFWVASELLRNYLLTGFPWANLGYSQARHLAIAQLAALGGVYLVAALVALVNGAAADVLLAFRARRRMPWRTVAVAAVALAGAAAWGSARLAGTRQRIEAAPKLEVALVQGNIDQSVKNERQANAAFIIGRYVPLTEEADRRGVDLVAWPEATYPYGIPSAIESFARLPGMTPLRRAHLLAGAGTWDPAPGGGRREGVASNSVFLLSPSLEVMGRYAKHHLVPFGEYVPSWLPFVREIVPVVGRQVPGGELTVLSFPAPGGAEGDEVTLAPMICFDAIFPEVNVAFARRDPEPEILVNPTNDAWYGYSSAPHQFLAMVRMRAIEAGKAVARPAWAGISALILPTGEVVSSLGIGPVDPDRAPDPDEPSRLLVGTLPRLRGLTPYTRFGDLFAWTATVVAAGLAAAALRRGSRR